MATDVFTATVIATGEEVQVYKHKSTGDWVLYSDCTTMYKDEQLKF